MTQHDGKKLTLLELMLVARFLRDTPFLSLVRTIVKSRWLRWYDATLDDPAFSSSQSTLEARDAQD